MYKTAMRICAAFLILLTVTTGTSALTAEESEPTVCARSAVLLEADSGQVIYEKNCDEKLPMASTTKIMTALVTLEGSELEREVTVPQEAVTVEGSKAYLKGGEKITVESLLYALMLDSANDAAVTLAVRVGGSIDGFADMMNEKAAALGLSHTHFTNPHGLDDAEHYTTARELAVLTAEALKNAKFREVVSTEKKVIPLTDGTGQRVMLNHNKLLRTEEDVIGVKTGYTQSSGRCLVSAAQKDGVTVVAVTLNDPDDWRDHKALLGYGLSKYERIGVASPESITARIGCIGGATGITLTNRDGAEIVIPRGKTVKITVEADRFYPAPVKEGQILGRALFTVDGTEVGEVPMYAKYSVDTVKTEGLIERILRFFGIG